jgi:hypothetical protein
VLVRYKIWARHTKTTKISGNTKSNTTSRTSSIKVENLIRTTTAGTRNIPPLMTHKVFTNRLAVKPDTLAV